MKDCLDNVLDAVFPDKSFTSRPLAFVSHTSLVNRRMNNALRRYAFNLKRTRAIAAGQICLEV